MSWCDEKDERSVGEIKLCTKRIAMRLVSQGDLHVVHLQPCCSEHKADRLTLGGSVWTLYGPQFYGAVSKSFICTAFCGAGTFLICTLLFLHLSWWFDFFFVRFFFLFSLKNQSMLCRYKIVMLTNFFFFLHSTLMTCMWIVVWERMFDMISFFCRNL